MSAKRSYFTDCFGSDLTRHLREQESEKVTVRVSAAMAERVAALTHR